MAHYFTRVVKYSVLYFTPCKVPSPCGIMQRGEVSAPHTRAAGKEQPDMSIAICRVQKIGSPKDLAESGELSRFIERKDIVFDKETLSIKVKRL